MKTHTGHFIDITEVICQQQLGTAKVCCLHTIEKQKPTTFYHLFLTPARAHVPEQPANKQANNHNVANIAKATQNNIGK